ncbi:MAG: polyamine aminopropyltransferase [Vampirovibrionales bacterium]|nr:polyamine aminopropyltransferase [Vampirovibrionales bacterium]
MSPANQDLWVSERFKDAVETRWRVKETLYHAQSEFQTVDIVDTEFWGRMLLLDGLVMTTEKDEHTYHEMITHTPMLAHPNPKQVLVIGGGDGGTIREVLKHPSVERAVLCEIDQLVIDSSREFLPSIAGALDDPRVDIQVRDGAAYIAQHANTFDVILIDSTDPIGPGARLFNHEFYTNVKNALSEQGVMAAQTESPISQPSEVREINTLLNGVFPVVKTYTNMIPTYPGNQWTWTFCSKQQGPFDLVDAKRVEAIEKTCRVFNRHVHRAIFALPNYIQEMIAPHSFLYAKQSEPLSV